MVTAIDSKCTSRKSLPILKVTDPLTELTSPVLGLISSYFNKAEEGSFLIINKKIEASKGVIKKNAELHLMLSLRREIAKISLSLDKEFKGSILDQEIKKLLHYLDGLREQDKTLCGNEYRKLLYVFFQTTSKEKEALEKLSLRYDVDFILKKAFIIELMGVNGIIHEVDIVLRAISRNLLLKEKDYANALLLAKLIVNPKIKTKYSIFFAIKKRFNEAIELADSIEEENYREEALKGIQDQNVQDPSCCTIL